MTEPANTTRSAPTRRFASGAIIFNEGESGRLAYVVESGEVELIKTTEHGGAVLGVIGPGALFGEMAILDGGPRAATARARGDVTLREIERGAFLGHLAAGPDRAFQLLGRLANYARENARLAALNDAEGKGRGPGPDATRDAPADAPDLEAIWRAGPSKLLSRVAAAAVGILGVTVLAAALAFVDKTVTTRGRLTTEAANVVVQAGLDAKVREVLARRGDRVMAGQPLVTLDESVVRLSLEGLSARAAAAEQRIERLRRERDAIERLTRGGSPPEAAPGLDPRNAEALARRLDEYRARLEAFDQKLAVLRHRAETMARDAALVAEQFAVKARIEDAREGLYNAGNGPLLNFLTSKDDRLSTQRELEGLREGVGDLRGEAASVEADRAAFVASWIATLSTDLASEVERLDVIRAERAKVEGSVADAVIRAPVDGFVLDFPSLEQGSVVRNGQALMTLVRADAPLSFEVDVAAKDVSDLRPGQPVSIKLDAYPFQRFGDLAGSLRFVGRDTVPESQNGEKGAFYRARVDFDAAAFAGGAEQLIPGMQGRGDIRVGERRLITYFTDPILGAAHQAFREPR